MEKPMVVEAIAKKLMGQQLGLKSCAHPYSYSRFHVHAVGSRDWKTGF